MILRRGVLSAFCFCLGDMLIFATNVSIDVNASDSSDVSLESVYSNCLDSSSIMSRFCLYSSIFVVNA